VAADDLYARAARAIRESELIRATARNYNAVATKPVRLLLDSIAHDLASAVGAAQMSLAAFQKDAATNAKSPDHVRLLERSLEHVAQLVADLRDSRQMDRGEFAVLPNGDVSPAALVLGAVDAAAVCADGRRLETACAPGLPSVRADERHVMRVFANLIGNAIRFTEPQGMIIVGARPGATDDEVIFFVRDDGEGIPEAEQRWVFEPYWRGRDAGGPGTGLGLTVCRTIVEAHGGYMFVTSRPKFGSTISFTLPATGGTAGEA